MDACIKYLVETVVLPEFPSEGAVNSRREADICMGFANASLKSYFMSYNGEIYAFDDRAYIRIEQDVLVGIVREVLIERKAPSL